MRAQMTVAASATNPGKRRREPGEAEDADRIFGEHLSSGGTKEPVFEIGPPTGGIGNCTVRHVDGDGIDGEVTAPEVGEERPAPQVPDVDLSAAGDQAKRAESLSPQSHQARPCRLGEAPGQRRAMVGDDEVEIVHRKAEGGVAYRTSDEVDRDARRGSRDLREAWVDEKLMQRGFEALRQVHLVCATSAYSLG